MSYLASITNEDRYVSLREGCRVLSKSASVVNRLAVIGRIRVRLLPGETPKYSLQDLRRIAGEDR